ncbi:something about silencing protein 10 [Eurosta solidaginis]|uniref:something about silencing protein 10 n=1 Tax=Eurosta solidaginis TaxID=178769 RepID=UPI003530C115
MGDKIRLDNNQYEDADDYEPTDSEAEYSEEDKELLRQVRERRRRTDESNEQELMAFDESEDDEDADVGDLMQDSDIEGADSDDDLPDTRDWGNKSRNYYNTDFVDPDYSTYTAEQDEMAKEEEEEAKKIQIRLAKQMKEEDFLLDDTILNDVTPTVEKQQRGIGEETITIKADLSGLTKRDKLRLFQEDSPEFTPLVSDFELYIKEAEQLISPVLQYVHKNKVPIIPALQFAQLYQNLALSYCSNVAFYLLLKAKRVTVRNHPVTKRLLQFKKLIKQLQDKYDNIIRPQLEALLERIVDGDKFQVLNLKDIAERTKSKKKKKLGILHEYDAESKTDMQQLLESTDHGDEDFDKNGVEDMDAEDEENENTRRGITYQIAKNKGLTPARKKEARNPRVKHRNKFRKALVRRKGAVRTVRKETKRYGGEISGIKTTVSKSIKFKV